MKVFITVVYAIACIVIIGFSHYYWTDKTTIRQAAGQINDESTQADMTQDSVDQLLLLTKNWPEQSVERFKQTLSENKPFKIIIAGSPALGAESGWAAKTKSSLIEAFGSENISVEIKEYDMTSDDFIAEEKDQELAGLNGDMILFEPFILKNNGKVAIGDTISQLNTIIETVKQSSPQTVFLLQPSYPVYKAKIYPNQVDKLKAYAEENNIPFLDHWQAWPNPDSEEIKSYLSEDQSNPNEKGHEVWGNFISDYLISQ
jgi:hypothetical protein